MLLEFDCGKHPLDDWLRVSTNLMGDVWPSQRNYRLSLNFPSITPSEVIGHSTNMMNALENMISMRSAAWECQKSPLVLQGSDRTYEVKRRTSRDLCSEFHNFGRRPGHRINSSLHPQSPLVHMHSNTFLVAQVLLFALFSVAATQFVPAVPYSWKSEIEIEGTSIGASAPIPGMCIRVWQV